MKGKSIKAKLTFFVQVKQWEGRMIKIRGENLLKSNDERQHDQSEGSFPSKSDNEKPGVQSKGRLALKHKQ